MTLAMTLAVALAVAPVHGHLAHLSTWDRASQYTVFRTHRIWEKRPEAAGGLLGGIQALGLPWN